MTGNEGEVYEQVPNVKGKFALYPSSYTTLYNILFTIYLFIFIITLFYLSNS